MANETNKSSDEAKQPIEANVKTPPNWTEADKKVASIQGQLDTAKGKVGHNPYLWMKDNAWNFIVAGIKARQLEALDRLNKLPNTINTTVENAPKGPLTVESSTKK